MTPDKNLCPHEAHVPVGRRSEPLSPLLTQKVYVSNWGEEETQKQAFSVLSDNCTKDSNFNMTSVTSEYKSRPAHDSVLGCSSAQQLTP